MNDTLHKTDKPAARTYTMAPDGAQVVVDRVSEAWVDEDGVVRVRVLPGAHIERADALRSREHMSLMNATGPVRVLIDMRAVHSISREAREEYTKHGGSAGGAADAVALVISSPVSRVIANFFLGLNRPEGHLMVFTSLRRAKAWLMQVV